MSIVVVSKDQIDTLVYRDSKIYMDINLNHTTPFSRLNQKGKLKTKDELKIRVKRKLW